MLKSNLNYGKIIEGLEINGIPAPYGVVNERTVRAAAGLMFVVAFFTMIYSILTKDLTLLKIILPIYWISFLLKVLIGPNWSIFSIIGDFLVRSQKVEYVGALQKRFAWGIGLLMSSIMMILVFAFNVQGIILLAVCGLCVVFMWFESACGICVGCYIYGFLRKKQWISEPEFAPVCPGGVCSLDNRPQN